jgi:hypothetical protein
MSAAVPARLAEEHWNQLTPLSEAAELKTRAVLKQRIPTRAARAERKQAAKQLANQSTQPINADQHPVGARG